MHDLFMFMGTHPFSAFFLGLILCGVIQSIFDGIGKVVHAIRGNPCDDESDDE